MITHRSIAVVILLAGVGLSGLAVMQAQAYVARLEAENTIVQDVPTTPVLVFKQDLPQGHLVTPDDLVTVEYVTGAVPPAATQDAVDRWVTRDVQAGQPVLAALVSVEPVGMLPVFVKVRRGTETKRECVARCPEDAL